MPRQFVLRDEIVVRAPLERCFVLATSVEIVQSERACILCGGTKGLFVGGDAIRGKAGRSAISW